jgi:hypothetical protein
MSNLEHQPDFQLTIGGTDVTNSLERWELQDVEDGISSIHATLVNHDGKFSGKFKIDDKMVLRWGYRNNMGPKVTMEVSEIHENYTDRGIRSIIVGLDPFHRLTGASSRGNFEVDGDLMQCIKDLGDSMGVKVEGFEGCENPKQPPEALTPIQNERHSEAMRRLLNVLTLKTRKSGGGGKVPRAGGAGKPLKALRQPKKPGSFNGTMKLGSTTNRGGGNRYAALKGGTGDKEVDELMANAQAQASDQASSTSIRGLLELVGVPNIKAKKCLTVKNVGSLFSGEWYCRGVVHEWTVKGGYWTRCDLITDQLGPAKMDQESSKPLVMHADIYKEESIYAGPRDVKGGSQATFTFGQAEKRIHSFKGTVVVQDSKECGEAADAEGMFLDEPFPKEKEPEQGSMEASLEAYTSGGG